MYTVEEVERIKREVRVVALRQAAMIADEMAEDVMDHAEDVPSATTQQVANGYKMIARLIRRLELDDQ